MLHMTLYCSRLETGNTDSQKHMEPIYITTGVCEFQTFRTMIYCTPLPLVLKQILSVETFSVRDGDDSNIRIGTILHNKEKTNKY